MYEGSSPLSPVVAFEFYLTKIDPDCQALFQTPNNYFNKSGAA